MESSSYNKCPVLALRMYQAVCEVLYRYYLIYPKNIPVRDILLALF